MDLLKFLSCYSDSGRGRGNTESLPAPEGPFQVKLLFGFTLFMRMFRWVIMM